MIFRRKEKKLPERLDLSEIMALKQQIAERLDELGMYEEVVRARAV